MSNWDGESFDGIINHGHFGITDPGPLHVPIRSFSIQRNEQLELVLETHCSEDAKSTLIEHPAGTVRINTDAIELTNIGGIKARAVGVQPLHVGTSINYQTGDRGLREEARILHYIESSIRDDIEPAYTIEWLDNLGARDYIWPDIIKDNKDITETRIIGRDRSVSLSSTDEERSFGQGCVGFSVAGVQLYLCASCKSNPRDGSRLGCIVYFGNPDEDTRRKIRDAISYALNVYLVYLGNTVYSADWHTIYFRSVSAYSIGRRVFDLPVLPPAPLGPSYQHEMTASALARMVNGIYAHYDTLKFGSLSWAYWHSLCATTHISGVHFGALIEALQRNYVKAHRESFKSKLVPDAAMWRRLSREIQEAISRVDVGAADKEILVKKAGNLNQMPRSETMQRILKDLKIELGEDERRAWARRDHAAHGTELRREDQLGAIRDTKLLRGIFDRILLRVTNGSDTYHDYASFDFPIRNLSDPVPIAFS